MRYHSNCRQGWELLPLTSFFLSYHHHPPSGDFWTLCGPPSPLSPLGIDDTPLISPSPSPSPLFCIPKVTTLRTRFDLVSPSRGVHQLATPWTSPPSTPSTTSSLLWTPLPTPSFLCHQLLPWWLGITLLATASSSKGTAHPHTRYTAIDNPWPLPPAALGMPTPALGPPLPIHPLPSGTLPIDQAFGLKSMTMPSYDLRRSAVTT